VCLVKCRPGKLRDLKFIPRTAYQKASWDSLYSEQCAKEVRTGDPWGQVTRQLSLSCDFSGQWQICFKKKKKIQRTEPEERHPRLFSALPPLYLHRNYPHKNCTLEHAVKHRNTYAILRQEIRLGVTSSARISLEIETTKPTPHPSLSCLSALAYFPLK